MFIKLHKYSYNSLLCIIHVLNYISQLTMIKDDRERKIYKVTLQGSLVNFLLMLFKLFAGFFGRSSAMIADGVHSLTDFITDFIVIAFVRISNKPRDENHDYGHGKFETLASVIIGLFLLVVGFGILINGGTTIYKVMVLGEHLDAPSILALVAAILSLTSKEILFRYTYKVGCDVNSEAMKSNAWHHRSDAFSSIGTTIGIAGAILLGSKWSILDPLAAIIVSLLIIKEAVGMLKNYIDELLEKSLPGDIEQDIVGMAMSTDGVIEVVDLKSRRIGNYFAVDFKVVMEGDDLLRVATERVHKIENDIRAKYGKRTQIGIFLQSR